MANSTRTVGANSLPNTNSPGEGITDGTEIVHARDLRNMAASFVGFSLNVIALVAIIKCKQCKNRHKVCFMSIAVVDISISLAVLFLPVVLSVPAMSQLLCLPVLVTIAFCVAANPGLVLVLALDRLHAVFFPHSYRIQRRPTQKALLMTIPSWVAAAILDLFLFNGATPNLAICSPIVAATHAGQTAYGVVIVVYTCVTMAVYVTLACKLTLCRRHNGRLHPSLNRSGISGAAFARTRTMTIRSTVLVAWCCISYLPFGAYGIWFGTTERNPMIELQTGHYLILTAAPLLNAIVDPLILLWQLGLAGTCVRRLKQRCCPTLGRNAVGQSVVDGTLQVRTLQVRTLQDGAPQEGMRQDRTLQDRVPQEIRLQDRTGYKSERHRTQRYRTERHRTERHRRERYRTEL